MLVDGIPFRLPDLPTYLMLNKPAGVITSRSDPHADQTVMDLLGGAASSTFPVGRLDRDTSGLLLLTNDGDLAYRLSHPKFGVEKVYRALVYGHVREDSLQSLRSGILLEDGITAPAHAAFVKMLGRNSIIEIGVHEGRKRQVRRMVEKVGHRVIDLQRIRYGTLVLGDLAPGSWRQLSKEEVRSLQHAVGLQPSPKQ